MTKFRKITNLSPLRRRLFVAKYQVKGAEQFRERSTFQPTAFEASHLTHANKIDYSQAE